MLSFPQVHQLRRRPEFIRYIVILQTEEEGPKIATTHRHAERVVDRFQITGAWIVDMTTERLVPLRVSGKNANLSDFLFQWKANYLDKNWTFGLDNTIPVE